MGCSKLTLKIILFVFDIITLLSLIIIWVLGFYILLKSNKKTFNTKLASLFSLTFDLVIFGLMLKLNIKKKYSGKIGLGMIGRFFTIVFCIPGSIMFFNLSIFSEFEIVSKSAEWMMILVLIIVIILLISIMLDIFVKNQNTIINSLLEQSMAIDKDFKIMDQNALIK